MMKDTLNGIGISFPIISRAVTVWILPPWISDANSDQFMMHIVETGVIGSGRTCEFLSPRRLTSRILRHSTEPMPSRRMGYSLPNDRSMPENILIHASTMENFLRPKASEMIDGQSEKNRVVFQ
jgi:hypothetical protein